MLARTRARVCTTSRGRARALTHQVPRVPGIDKLQEEKSAAFVDHYAGQKHEAPSPEFVRRLQELSAHVVRKDVTGAQQLVDHPAVRDFRALVKQRHEQLRARVKAGQIAEDDLRAELVAMQTHGVPLTQDPGLVELLSRLHSKYRLILRTEMPPPPGGGEAAEDKENA